MTKFLTVYPDGWFGRTPTAKMHAFEFDGECDKYGHPLAETGRRLSGTSALCGVYGKASGNEFKARGGSLITCQRCVGKVKKAEGAVTNGTRYAKVKGPANEHVIAAYLPDNYRVVRAEADGVLIAGEDSAGWTLDDYVIPRLASGLYFAEEVPNA